MEPRIGALYEVRHGLLKDMLEVGEFVRTSSGRSGHTMLLIIASTELTEGIEPLYYDEGMFKRMLRERPHFLEEGEMYARAIDATDLPLYVGLDYHHPRYRELLQGLEV